MRNRKQPGRRQRRGFVHGAEQQSQNYPVATFLIQAQHMAMHFEEPKGNPVPVIKGHLINPETVKHPRVNTWEES